MKQSQQQPLPQQPQAVGKQKSKHQSSRFYKQTSTSGVTTDTFGHNGATGATGSLSHPTKAMGNSRRSFGTELTNLQHAQHSFMQGAPG